MGVTLLREKFLLHRARETRKPAQRQNLLGPISRLVQRLTVNPRLLLLSRLHRKFVLTYKPGIN